MVCVVCVQAKVVLEGKRRGSVVITECVRIHAPSNSGARHRKPGWSCFQTNAAHKPVTWRHL